MNVASQPAPDTLVAEPLADFVLVQTDQIDRGERLRPIDTTWAEALGQIMQREGQRTPIEVCRLPGSSRWTLVSGAHRHAGAESAGIAYLRAEIVSAGRDDRRMREVSENLWRSDLAPVDRAAFIAEAVAIHKRRAGIDPEADGRKGSIAVRWQKALKEEAKDTTATLAGVYGFTDAIAGELNLSSRTVERSLTLYRRLAPSVIEKLREARHSIVNNATQLHALAKLPTSDQAQVVALLLATDAPARSVAGAIGYVNGKPAPDPEAKRLSAFIGAFQRMGLAEKKGALAHLAGMLPAGFALAERDGPIAPAGGAVLSKGAVDTIVAALSTGEFYHQMLPPAEESLTHQNWTENGGYIAKGLRVLDGARRPA